MKSMSTFKLWVDTSCNYRLFDSSPIRLMMFIPPRHLRIFQIYLNLICHLIIHIFTAQTRNNTHNPKPQRSIRNSPILGSASSITRWWFTYCIPFTVASCTALPTAATTAGLYVVANFGVPTSPISVVMSDVGTPAATAAAGTSRTVHFLTELVKIAR